MAMQDALHLWQRNKDEEGGGGYLAWNWDSSIWGADVLLAQQTSDAKYGGEVQLSGAMLVNHRLHGVSGMCVCQT